MFGNMMKMFNKWGNKGQTHHRGQTTIYLRLKGIRHTRNCFDSFLCLKFSGLEMGVTPMRRSLQTSFTAF